MMPKRNFALPFNQLPSLGQPPASPVINPAEAARTLHARTTRRPHVEDDWRARPTVRHPYPVVLIHGTGDDNNCWFKLAPQLRNSGYCVFAPNYGNFGVDALEDNADQVAAYCDAVLTITGAEALILIGHSQGGLLARHYALHNPTQVKHVIAVAATNQRTTVADMIKDTALGEQILTDFFGLAGWEQIAGSTFYEELATFTELPDSLGYTCIASRTDGTVVPPEHCFLPGADNLWVQDAYPKSRVPHTQMPLDRHVRHMIMKALRHARI
ncbi:MAG: alpha/beta fold hydrolase [Corynebacterium sp.]|nr:alpha/beta fold hydrolase [Corynebacterium sp.]